MPPKVNPVCIECKCTESLLWRTNEQGQICQECFQQNETRAVNIASLVNDANGDMKSTPNKENDNKEINSTETKGGNNNSINGDEKRLRKSTRATRYKSKPSVSNSSTNGEKTVNATSNKSQIKGRSRRTLFKKIPYKTPVAQATTHSVQSVFHKVLSKGLHLMQTNTSWCYVMSVFYLTGFLFTNRRYSIACR